jgi:hypothetical protein
MAGSEVVPFLSMPSCAFENCVKDNSSALPCPTLTTPCRLLFSASPTTSQSVEAPATTVTSDDSLCTTVPLSCYCNLADPLQCAWKPCRIDARDPSGWLLAEDWFNATCPSASPSPFDTNSPKSKSLLPARFSTCLQDQAFASGCIIEKTICFCPIRSLFGCASGCSTTENATIANWYSSVCAVSLTDATAALQNVDVPWPVIPAKDPWPGLVWYEILVLVVLGLIAGIGLIYLWMREWLRKRSQKHVAQKKSQ